RRRRVVLVVEGAHRGDADSQRVMAALVEPPLPGVVLVIVGRNLPVPVPLFGLADLVVRPCRVELGPRADATDEPQAVNRQLPDDPAVKVASIARIPLDAVHLTTITGVSAQPHRIHALYELEDQGVLDTMAE